MNKDIKAIFEGYDQGINHTSTKNSPFDYKVTDYAFSREEQEEGGLRKEILSKLNIIYKKAISGSQEDYKNILFLLKQLEQMVSRVAGK